MVVPWPTPSPEVQIDSFMPDFITVDAKGFLRQAGVVRISPQEILLSTTAQSQPTVHVLTSEVPITVTFSVTILRRQGRNLFPFQAKVWNASAEVAAEVWYTADGTIMAGARLNERWSQIRRVATYKVGEPKSWQIAWNDRRLLFEVRSSSGHGTFELTHAAFPPLFEQGVLSVTMYATGLTEGSSVVSIRDPIISVPHQTKYGTSVASRFFRPIVVIVALVSLLWLIVWTRGRWKRPNLPVRPFAIMLLLVGASLLAGWWLSHLPGHPLDVRGEVLWSRIAKRDGPAAIVGHSFLATLGNGYGNQPYAPMTYPYPPLLTYLFWVIGRVAPIGRLEQTMKITIMLGVAAGGCMLFALLHRLRVDSKLVALATSAYILNPAILFDSAVWGQTDAFVGLFLLTSLAGAVLESAPLLWTGALLAFLTKQTGGFIALFVLVLGFANLDAHRMARGVLPAIMIVFLALVPAFLAGVHPSAIYRPVITKALSIGVGTDQGVEAANAVVSQSSFTLWSTVTRLEGVHGWTRLAFPDLVPSRWGPSYFLLSRLVFALFVTLLILLIVRKRPVPPGVVFLAMAAYTVGAAVLPTRILPRYFFFGVLFTAASLPWMTRRTGITTVAILTGTMLLSMWGLLVFISVTYPGLLSVFAPDHLWLNRIALNALGTDVGITLGGILNMGVLLTLLVILSRPLTQERSCEQTDALEPR